MKMRLPHDSGPVDKQHQLVLIGQRIIAAVMVREMGNENKHDWTWRLGLHARLFCTSKLGMIRAF
jgi:hypothetical protein